MENQQENNALLNGTDVLNVEQRTKDFKGLCCCKVEAIKYFWIIGYEILWIEFSHSESLKLPVKKLFFSKFADCIPATLFAQILGSLCNYLMAENC